MNNLHAIVIRKLLFYRLYLNILQEALFPAKGFCVQELWPFRLKF